MNEKNRNLVARVVTSVIGLPLVLYLLWLGGFWSVGLLAWAAGACAAEYYQITHKQKLGGLGWVAALVAALVPVLPVLTPTNPWELAFWALGGLFLLASSVQVLKGGGPEAPTNVAHLVTAVLYAGMGLGALSWVRLLPNGGLALTVAALVITWANDTVAYFAGRFFGRHKLAPTVSPNKTWEGFAGGVVGSVGGMFVFKALWFPEYTVLDCLVLGLGGSVLGPLGDLTESMLKRAYGVKDSGRLLPGHGGILDRLDALLFNAPLVLVYVQFFRP